MIFDSWTSCFCSQFFETFYPTIDLVLQIYHVKNKCKPFTLSSVKCSWKLDGSETITKFDTKCNQSGSFVSIISEVAEDVSSQLHYGILKSARRVVLDEIISNVIAEFVTTTKAQRLNQSMKTCSLDAKRVSF